MIRHTEFELKLPAGYTDAQLRRRLGKRFGDASCSFRILRKSLDARRGQKPCWQLRLAVAPKGEKLSPVLPPFSIPYRKRSQNAVVVGGGPAGIFSAIVLQKAGIHTSLLERGLPVGRRAAAIHEFETTAQFHPKGNYPFGEGGAGAFSDGKLTSRSKRLSPERAFILSELIKAGAPEEITYLSHPHLGSDRLPQIVKNLRKAFTQSGGEIRFGEKVNALRADKGRIAGADTESGTLEADHWVIATGHSAFDTYRMLLECGVAFGPKPFALGFRMEHRQTAINLAQWGCKSLPGVKAAEYRLTSKGHAGIPVYTFCMCPGGVVVPSMAYEGLCVVNGMSSYQRDGAFANAACVAATDLGKILGREPSASEALDWLEKLEREIFRATGSYNAPFCDIKGFLGEKPAPAIPDSSYPLGLTSAPLWEFLPTSIIKAIRAGLQDFCRQVKGFDSGILLGLESKTSSPIQVLREKDMRCKGFENLYVVGEGSGHAGGIVSSAADGIKAAMEIARK